MARVGHKVVVDKALVVVKEHRSGSSWKEETEEYTVAVHTEAVVGTATGAVVQLAGTGRIQSAAAAEEGSCWSMSVVAVVGTRPEDKLGLVAAVVHQGRRPVVVTDRIW